MKIFNFESFLKINEEDSAMSGPSGMGDVISSQPSTFSGTTVGPNFAAGGGTIGSGDVSIPYNATAGDKMFQKIQLTGNMKKLTKKSPFKKISKTKIKDFTKEPKVLNYDNFVKSDMFKIKK